MPVTQLENDRLNKNVMEAADGDIDRVFETIRELKTEKQRPPKYQELINKLKDVDGTA